MSSCVEFQMYGSPSPAAPTDLNRPFPPPSANQMSSGSGLLRYRSAPSSVFGELLCEDLLPVNRPSSPDTDSMFARFLSPENPPSSGGGERRGSQLPPHPPVMYHQHHRHHQNHQIQGQMAAAAAAAARAMDSREIKNVAGGGGGGGGNCSNLVRHSSSPAGVFDQLHVENGYGVMRGIGGYRNGNESRLKRQSSSTAAGLMSQISEIDEESMGGYGWEEQRSRDNQSGNGTLNHHLSLPKTSSEMSAIEMFLQLQDSVPCKIRAKRGCATHPRSIAERVRRTRISERMRKLQELVPNMDKQTNTADMLDLAVDYIKDLQKQVKTISDRRANCTCSSSSKRKPYTNSTV